MAFMISMTALLLPPNKKEQATHTAPQKRTDILATNIYFLTDNFSLPLLKKSSTLTADRELTVELNVDIAADIIPTINIPIKQWGKYFKINIGIIRSAFAPFCANSSAKYFYVITAISLINSIESATNAPMISPMEQYYWKTH